MANEIPKNHSEASRAVLKSGCTIYSCINAALGACMFLRSGTVRGGGGGRSKRHPVFGVRVQNVISRHFCAIVAAAHAVADSRERVAGAAADLRRLHKYNTARARVDSTVVRARAQHCSVK